MRARSMMIVMSFGSVCLLWGPVRSVEGGEVRKADPEDKKAGSKNDLKNELKKYEIQITLDETIIISESAVMRVEVKKYLPLRFADVYITPKEGSEYNMMLYFKCDTADLHQFDTLEKIEKSVRVSSEVYLAGSVEKTIKLNKISKKGRYGCYAIFTDKKYEKIDKIPDAEFKYISRGMIRISNNSALGFSIMTKSLDTPGYKALLEYVYSFVRENKDSNKEN